MKASSSISDLLLFGCGATKSIDCGCVDIAFVRGGVGGGFGRGARCAWSSRYTQHSNIKVGMWYRSKGQPLLWRVWCGL